MDGLLPATASRVYGAFTSSTGHSRMTGGAAQITAKVGEPFVAWDGYITGRNLVVEPRSRVVQTWRTMDFDKADDDSLVEVLFLDEGPYSRMVIHHTYLPRGGRKKYTAGWTDHYFHPMGEYFARLMAEGR
jgi:activator of HSP90 ATPase